MPPYFICNTNLNGYKKMRIGDNIGIKPEKMGLTS